jgi:ATP-dependent Zn protease
VLLEGEPGTGKTMLAKAFASELGLPFIQKNATEFLVKWVGDGAKSIRELFATARRYSPCVIFIDEIDVIAKSRTDNPSDHHHTQDLTNAFLSELDGFADNKGAPVFVVCATNFSTKKGDSALDAAFLRRFDKKVYVDLPNKEEREKFLKNALSKISGSTVTDEKIHLVSKRSVGWSLADLNLVVQNAVRRYEDEKGVLGVDDEYFNDEFENFSDGERKKTKPEDLRKTAIHEAGHAVVAKALGIPSVYTTIISRGNYGGYVYFADEEKTGYTRDELLNKICMAMAGRASEVLEFGAAGINTGASGDIKTASSIARNMICSYGMVEDCFLFFDTKNGREPDFVAEKAQAILKEQYARATELLKNNKSKVNKVAEALLDKNSLSEEELDQLLAKD